MRVVLRLSHPKLSSKEIFDKIVEQFKIAKENDDLNLAHLDVGDDYAEYYTCCGNTWRVEFKEGNCYFSYEGTRAGLLRLQPFCPMLRWVDVFPNDAVLRLIVEFDIVREAGGSGRWVEFPRKFYDFEAIVVDYYTSTPAEWRLGPFDLLEKIGDGKAVILRNGRYPDRVVSYKDVYHSEQTEVVE